MNELAAELEAFGAGQAGEDNIIDPSESEFTASSASTPCLSLSRPHHRKGLSSLKGFRSRSGASSSSPWPAQDLTRRPPLPTVDATEELHAHRVPQGPLLDETVIARAGRGDLQGAGRVPPAEPRPAQGVSQHVPPQPLRHVHGQDPRPERDEAHVEEPAQDGQGHPPGKDDGPHPRAQQTAALADREAHLVRPPRVPCRRSLSRCRSSFTLLSIYFRTGCATPSSAYPLCLPGSISSTSCTRQARGDLTKSM